MRTKARIVIILLALGGAACTSRMPAPGQGQTRLRIIDTGPKDIKTLPFLMAVDTLRRQGGITRGVNVAMFKQFIAERCPGSQPHLLVIGSSNSRAAALLTGQVAAAQLEIQDVAHLDRQAPGRFHTLLQASKEFPHVVVVAYAVREEWARDHADALKAFIRTFVEAQRSLIDNPQRFRDEAEARLSLDAGQAQTLAETYRTRGLWDANGGLTNARVQSSIDFLTAAQALPPGVTPDRVTDLSYLNAVLDEIGRR